MAGKQYDPHEAVDFIFNNAVPFAQAKANRVHLEEFRKSKKALLMKECNESAVNAQEREAYSHPEYIQLLDGLREAVVKEETLRYQIAAAQARLDVWRTQSANDRALDKATQ